MYENIRLASSEDTEEILALYRTSLYGPADWNEDYPNEDTIAFDLSRNALIVKENENHQIIAVVSMDEDAEVDALSCWTPALQPGGELSRICVSEAYRGQGIAKEMMNYGCEMLKQQGKKSVHILVRQGHIVAETAYKAIGFVYKGDCELFDKAFICMEKELSNEIKPGRYRHFKGNEYEVIGIAKNSENLEEMVVYRALYGERALWVRPASMWNETVERDGKVYQRFTYTGDL